ncbi:hypothetical protein PFUGPA_00688 [Plasmodium falciparum Palo Alto/Uganda]|uniref:Uncharacterized protein n=2 Tax=Plasmodium falciparum TaxID=5833 RepID=W4J6F5_PLAFP|nr:hypothetical protein PFUGPA_00688 [Plasmodium falciparum Palo Alto/Uganda]ETW58847.1 hypothetical protein PFMC_05267 [Plasmodium falciparum CAMP/Malaysia]
MEKITGYIKDLFFDRNMKFNLLFYYNFKMQNKYYIKLLFVYLILMRIIYKLSRLMEDLFENKKAHIY